MLKRIAAIKNVGTFRECPESPELGKLVLVYGENGRGKTTLSAILSSLRSGNPNLIVERTTLDSGGAPSVHLLLDKGEASFCGGAWTASCSNIEIFDAAFVSENVHSGDFITHDNKKNLCRVILGAAGAQLAKNFDAADEVVRLRSKELSDAKEAILRLVPNGVGFEQFLGFSRDAEIEQKIAKKKEEIALLTERSAICGRGALALLDLPQPASTLTSMLQKTLEGISEDAERVVRQHIEKHKMDRGVAWLSEGLPFAGKDCPFCAQPLAGSPVIHAFASFFSQAYRNFQQELSQLKAAVDKPLSDAALLAVQKRLMDNEALVEFWKKYIPNPPAPLSFEERIRPVIQTLREQLAPLVDKKLQAPLELVSYPADALLAIEEWKKLRGEVQRYNTAISSFNASIEAVKMSMDTKNLAELQKEIALLEAQKFRYDPSAIDAVKSYVAANLGKVEAEEAKNSAKSELSAYNDVMIDQYRDSVNASLASFGVSASLGKMKIDYVGRSPRTSYKFTLRGTPIDPGGDTLCFRNTLSGGDRSALAFAFFIAQLKNRKDLADLIVVLDDPNTCLDSSRQSRISTMIQDLATQAAQVIVLSHSLDFLRLLAKDRAASALKIEQQNQTDSRLASLDL